MAFWILIAVASAGYGDAVGGLPLRRESTGQNNNR